MVLAAGRGTRLRPLTYEVPKPLLPVLDRPLMEHVVSRLTAQGVDDVVANLHYLPEAIPEYFGDRLTYRVEEELLGTAGAVRNCADLLGSERFVVASGSALTDLDLAALLARHEQTGGIATLAVARPADVERHTMVLQDAEGRVTGLQDRPDSAEALSTLAVAGTYVFEPGILEYVSPDGTADWCDDVFPALLDDGVPFHLHEVDGYWNPVSSLADFRAAAFDALHGSIRIDVAGDALDEGFIVGEGSHLGGVTLIEPPVWIGRDVEIGSEVRLEGPVAVHDGARIGDRASLKETVVLPGTDIAPDAIVAGGIVGIRGALAL
jgi:mannose-1-phosphate guanylyltransferase/mannose-1-phosphate guanylyltransferase/phosphomannomutase